MGDGVNIAARLESIAESGAICVSEDAYRQVKGRLDLTVSDLGPTQLKNIADPIRVYSLQVGVPAQAKIATEAKPQAHGGCSARTDRHPSRRVHLRRSRPNAFPSWYCPSPTLAAIRRRIISPTRSPMN
jgi:hypothetical protein